MKKSLLRHLLFCLAITLLLATGAMIFFANKEVRSIVDSSQNRLFSARIDTIINILVESNSLLNNTGMPESYIEDFQEIALQRLLFMYQRKEREAVLIILDSSNKQLLDVKYSESINVQAQSEFITLLSITPVTNKGYEIKNNQFWGMFREYEPWGWKVGFIIPLNKRYKDATKVVRGVSVLMIIITLILLSGGVFLIISFVRPLVQLKNAANGFAKQNFDLPVELGMRRDDEIGELAYAFSEMRINIQSKIHALSTVNEKLQCEGSERIKSEKEKAISELHYRHVFNAPSEAIFVHDGNTGEILDVNDSMLSTWGFKKEEVLSMPFSRLTFNEEPFDENNAKEIIQKAIHDGPQIFEWLSKKKNGQTFWTEITLSAYDVLDEKRVLAVCRDITKRKSDELEKENMETQLRQAQKMEAIGTLAGGIAHDFNNILTPIIGYSEMIIMGLERGTKEFGEMDIILNASLKAKDLVQQILTFSRQNEAELKPLKVQKIVEEAMRLLRSSIPSNIKVIKEIDNDCCEVIADSGQILRIIMNLCTNAYQAIRGRDGVLKVTLHEIMFTGLEFEFDEPKPFIYLTVSDNGDGIPKEDRERIFEPYFTTKQQTKGTGLGLSIVHGIITNLGGDIKVESNHGTGTTFHIYLPCGKALIDTEKQFITNNLNIGSEFVMIVDDEEHVLGFEKLMLEQLGYKVESFSDVREATKFFNLNKDDLDIVITDLTMPYMSGLEFSKTIHSIKPSLPIILTSGFSGVIDRKVADSVGIVETVNKPITIDDFSMLVRRALDKSKNMKRN